MIRVRHKKAGGKQVIMMIDQAKQRIIRVIGHKNPDTDSICSAVSYAYLKNQISGGKEHYEPRRAGEISKETAFVLNHFGVDTPRLSVDMSPTIANIDIRQEEGVDGQMSTRAAWQLMNDRNIDTLCVTDRDNNLLGIITVRDIANANMELFDTSVLAKARTSYKNLLEVLDGEMLSGDPNGFITTGQIHVGTSPEAMEELIHDGDLVMVTNRYEAQMCAIDYGAKCLVVCMGASVPDILIKRAQAADCTVIKTHYDTYAASRLVSMAAPIEHFMVTKNLVTFNINTPVDEARKVMASLRHRYFPILDKEGRYCGVISRRNLLNMHRKRVILVDHNEESQAVDGLEDAEILEIIDHHRLGKPETSGPVYFRNEPVGCTATIIYTMFHEQHVEIPKQIAGLLMSAILSDTLVFHSPTCTMLDKAAADDLASIAGENIDEYVSRMFEAGEDLTGRSAEDLLYTDYKEFAIGDSSICVGQGFFISKTNFDKAKALIQGYLPTALEHSQSNMIFYMLTSIPSQSTCLLYVGKGSDELIAEAFHVKAESGCAMLQGVVSRKKQFIPPVRDRILNPEQDGI